jgi:hypothetical protein
VAGDLIKKHLNNLKKREDFTNDEIDVLEDGIHLLSDGWIEMFRKGDMINYFYLLVNGCAIYFLRKWRNVYRFSKKGWEYQHKRIHIGYYHYTDRGGSNDTDGGEG